MAKTCARSCKPSSARRSGFRRGLRFGTRSAGFIVATSIAAGALLAPPAAAHGARYLGSVAGVQLQRPIVGMAATPSGDGYWLVASDGGIFTFGNARFHGSAAGRPAIGTMASMSASPHGGYWMVTTDGAVFSATRSHGLTPDPNLVARSPDAAVAQDLFQRINDERAARGLRTLTWDPVLTDLAAGWARRMAADGRMYHQNLQGLFGSPLVATQFVALRENIYTGNGSYRDAGSAHVAFMRSDPHRADILVPGLTSVGVGAACVNGALWVTEDFGIAIGNPAPGAAPVPPLDPIVRPDENGSSCH